MQMVVLNQRFLNIFMFIPCSLISIVIVHGPLPTRMQDHYDNSSNYSIKTDYLRVFDFTYLLYTLKLEVSNGEYYVDRQFYRRQCRQSTASN